MKKALIITGGYINYITVDISADCFDLIIAADSGYVAANKLGFKPDIIVGDFDSSPRPITDSELITVPAEKDDTDTMLACNIAVERGANVLTIVGGTGGRSDHFLSNIFSLETFKDRGIDAVLTDGDNTIQVLKNQTVILPKGNEYFSLFPLSTCEVSLSGCKYPLEKYTLTRSNPSFAVSNEVAENFATITVNGKAILCQCKK